MAVVYRHRHLTLVPPNPPAQFRGHGSSGRGQLTASVEQLEGGKKGNKKGKKKKIKMRFKKKKTKERNFKEGKKEKKTSTQSRTLEKRDAHWQNPTRGFLRPRSPTPG